MAGRDKVRDGNGGGLVSRFSPSAQQEEHPAEAENIALVGGADPREYAREMAAIRERTELAHPDCS